MDRSLCSKQVLQMTNSPLDDKIDHIEDSHEICGATEARLQDSQMNEQESEI